jgi:hypothetical protein
MQIVLFAGGTRVSATARDVDSRSCIGAESVRAAVHRGFGVGQGR